MPCDASPTGRAENKLHPGRLQGRVRVEFRAIAATWPRTSATTETVVGVGFGECPATAHQPERAARTTEAVVWGAFAVEYRAITATWPRTSSTTETVVDGMLDYPLPAEGLVHTDPPMAPADAQVFDRFLPGRRAPIWPIEPTVSIVLAVVPSIPQPEPHAVHHLQPQFVALPLRLLNRAQSHCCAP